MQKGKFLINVIFLLNDIHNEVVECNRRRLMTMGGSVMGKIYKRTFLLKNNLYFPEIYFMRTIALFLWFMPK